MNEVPGHGPMHLIQRRETWKCKLEWVDEAPFYTLSRTTDSRARLRHHSTSARKSAPANDERYGNHREFSATSPKITLAFLTGTT